MHDTQPAPCKANEPVASAAVLLWRAPAHGAQNLQIYLVQRAERVLFMPGYWALPGGKVELQDAVATYAPHGGEDAVADANARTQSYEALPAAQQRAHLRSMVAAEHCARRELFEEVGVWSFGGELRDAQSLQERRRAWLSCEPAAMAPQRASCAGLRPLRPLGTFVTPHFGNLRFSAHYFALEARPDERPEIWRGELRAGEWLTPEQALAQHAAALRLLAPPVMATLEALAAATGSAEARLEQAHTLLAQKTERFATVMVPRLCVAPVRSPTLPPSTHTNCYVLGETELAVVDPGTPYPPEQEALLGHLAGLEAQGAKVRQVWLTHHHPDHVGAAMALKSRFGAKILAHAQTARHLTGEVTVDAHVVDDQALAVGEDVYVALHTPGHAGGHLCFYDRRRGHLLSGDNVLGMGTSIVMPSPEGDMRAYVAGLERLLTLPLGLLLPGHGPPSARGEQRIADTLKQRYAREQMLLDLLDAGSGPVAVSDLVSKLYRGLTTGPGSLAALSCLAHLEKLMAEGVVRAHHGQGFSATVERVSRPV